MAAKGLTQKGVPPQPHWLFFVKVAILALSVLIFALACFVASRGYWAVGAAGFLIFVCIKTWIIYGIFLFLEKKHPASFFRIAALILYIFSIIFWLSAWAWAASIAGFWLSYVDDYCYGDYCYYSGTNFKGFGAGLAACAGLGAVLWVLSIINLVFFIKGCLADPEPNAEGQAELGHVKGQEAAAVPVAPQQAAYPPQQQYVQQQPQGYPQQPYPQ